MTAAAAAAAAADLGTTESASKCMSSADTAHVMITHDSAHECVFQENGQEAPDSLAESDQ